MLSFVGVKFGDAFSAVVDMVKKEKPDMVAKLTKNLGLVMGLTLCACDWKVAGSSLASAEYCGPLSEAP